MALKTKVEQETLDSIYLGQPYVEVSTTAIASQDLDTIFLGQPFVATDPPSGGVTEQGEAAVTASASVSASGDRIRFGNSSITVTASQTVTADRVRNISSNQNASASLTSTVSRTRTVSSSSTSAFSQTAVAGKIVQGTATFEGVFTPTLVAIAIRNLGSTMTISAAISADGVANRSTSVALENLANLSLQADKFVGFELALTVTASQLSSIDRITQATSALTSEFTQATTASRTLETSSLQSASFTQTTQTSVTFEIESLQDVVTDLTADGSSVIEFFADLVYEIPNITVPVEKIAVAQAQFEGVFTPTLTADVYKNHTANLETTTNLSADVSVITENELDCFSNFTSSASVKRSASLSSSISSSASIQAVIRRTRQFNLVLSTTATLSANVQERDLASASLSATFALTASLKGLVQTGRADLTSTFSQSADVREIPVDGWASQPNVRFLLHADSAPLVDETNNSTVTLETITEIPERSGTIVGGKFSNGVKGAFTTNQSNQLVVGTNDFILDGWFKPIDAVGTNDVDFGFLSDRVNNSRNLVGFIGIERQGTYANKLIYVIPGGNFANPDIVSNISYPLDGQFHHIMLSRNNYVLTLFIDGQSVGSAINYVNFTNNKIASDLQNPSIVDEVRLVIGEGQSTNFTPKTTPYAPIKQLYAVLETFSNFNLPEGLIVKFGQASLTSTATQTASVRRIRLGSASLTSTATVSVSATNIKRATSALSATASQTAQGIITKNTSGSLTSTASVSVAVTRIRSTTSAQTSAFTLTAQASRIRVGDSALSVTASQTANNSRTRNFDTAFDSIASQLAAVARIGDGFVAVDVNATMAVSAVKTATAVSEQQVNANISAQGIATVFGNSSLNSNFTATINIERVKPVGGELSATFTQTATVRKITDFVKNFEVTATVSADNTRVRASSSALASTATQNTVGDYLRLAQGTLSVNTELFVTVFSLVKAEANLQCQGFQLTAGRVIHLDPYYTYIIPQESREYIITEETREFKIEQETRKYIV